MNKVVSTSVLAVLAMVLSLGEAEAIDGSPDEKMSHSSAVRINSDNVLVVDGEPFFPLGFFHVDLEYLPTLSSYGFNSSINFMSGPEAGKVLDVAHQNQIKIIGEFFPSFVQRMELFRSVIEEFKEHPAILAWDIVDEPELRGEATSPEKCLQAYELVKSIDPHHPVYLNTYRYESLSDYSEAADILSNDHYPVPLHPLTLVVDSVQQTRAAVQDRKPAFIALQAHNPGDYSEDAKEWGRYPTPEEERCMTYLAIVHGARGIFYFCYGALHKSHEGKQPAQVQLWEELKKLASEIKELTPVILSPTPEQTVSTDSPKIHVLYREYGDVKYIIAVNPENERQSDVVFSLPSLAGQGKAKALFEDRITEIRNESFRDGFEEYAVHVYEIRL